METIIMEMTFGWQEFTRIREYVIQTKTLCEATCFICSCANLRNLVCFMNLFGFYFHVLLWIKAVSCIEESEVCIVLFVAVCTTAGLRWQKKNLTVCIFSFLLWHLRWANTLTLGLLECQAESLFVLSHTLILSHLRGSFINSHCVK